MSRAPHENVATVLVDPRALPELELALMALDLRVWPIATAPICLDGPRRAFQIRRQLIDRHDWAEAADWVPVWVGFDARWQAGPDPLPWAAHQALWTALEGFAAHVRYRRRLGGVRRLALPEEQAESRGA